MATLILSAVGASLGATLGTGALGIAGAAVGQAAGALIGRSIDQRLLGGGSESVDVGRIDRFRLMGASEGTAIPRVWGRFRVGGQVIWASQFREDRQRRSSGKGGGRKATITEYAYSVSLAVALCEGPIRCIGRVWADGNEIAASGLSMRVYEGTEGQLPDPLIEATEGAGNGCAYRGLAYVVIEDLDLGRFGNRVPQFSFEVVRQASCEDRVPTLADSVRAVALIPGTGEYALATTAVRLEGPPGAKRTVNVHAARGGTDMTESLRQLRGELPRVSAVSLVVSWFGDDLRCGSCRVRPKVEQRTRDGQNMPWRSAGIERRQAEILPQLSGRSIFGGTPSDQSVVEAIRAIHAGGQSVMFYPFVLMDILAGNQRPDPWRVHDEQPQLPWRGRITLEIAPGRSGTADRSAAAAAEIKAFFGTSSRSHFRIEGGRVEYDGPQEWSYRRFILHYAFLCAVAGGVDAFCVGSELKGLTCVRDGADEFPAAAELKHLADDVRQILGPNVKIGYAADWSDYSNYSADGNLYFHLDSLWSHHNIDFVGIDNYLPLSDWRDGDSHADSSWGSYDNPSYLYANVAGGEWFDWYYDSEEGARDQRRIPIADGTDGHDWVFRCKDIRSWWENLHQDRREGERLQTAWNPQMKPIWFTEYGCPAIDCGTNQPNVFVDPRSSESRVPLGSLGVRDDFIQSRYFEVMQRFWEAEPNNPISSVYGGAMVDMSHAYAWAWDARPFPQFPGLPDVWDDGRNHELGHWLNGRSGSEVVENVIREIVGPNFHALGSISPPAVLRGYAIDRLSTARAALQPIALILGVDFIESGGRLLALVRNASGGSTVYPGRLAISGELDGVSEISRSGSGERSGALVLTYVRDQASFEVATTQSWPTKPGHGSVDQLEFPVVMTPNEARSVVERSRIESVAGLEGLRLALPLSMSALGPGDMISFDDRRYRISRVERSSGMIVEAMLVDTAAYHEMPSDRQQERMQTYDPGAVVEAVFLDLPIMQGDEDPASPHVAVTALPWPGPVAVWTGSGEDGFEFNTLVTSPAVIGVTETVMPSARIGLPDRGIPLRVAFGTGEVSAAGWESVLSGANLAAIGSGASGGWELFQFARAELVAPDTFELSLRLRGQFGTDCDMPPEWPEGSVVVVLSDALRQIALGANFRGLQRTYRVGLASLGYANEDCITLLEKSSGIGLRPYSVSHLKCKAISEGGLELNWLRRARVEGDSWETADVPLGEANERYMVRVSSAGTPLREVVVDRPSWIYPAGWLSADRSLGALTVSVAQISDRFGPGPFKVLEV